MKFATVNQMKPFFNYSFLNYVSDSRYSMQRNSQTHAYTHTPCVELPFKCTSLV